MPDNHQSTILRNWGQLGRQLACSRATDAASWEAAGRMIAAATPHFKSLVGRLDDVFAKSDKLLKPLADPLRTDFGLHRWLAGDREEAYSDWLAWIMQQVESPAAHRLLAIKELFPDKPVAELNGEDRLDVRREVCVPEGHSDKQGRLDLVIGLQDRAVVVLEVKVGNADASNTEKQKGYESCLNRRYGTVYPILLASDGSKAEYDGGFRLLRWSELCLRLRHLAVELCSTQKIVLAAMTLAFVGAIEQNLLGFSVPANDFQRTFDPAVFVHLERWIEESSE